MAAKTIKLNESMTTGKIAKELEVGIHTVQRAIRKLEVEPDSTAGMAGIFGPEKIKQIKEYIKGK